MVVLPVFAVAPPESHDQVQAAATVAHDRGGDDQGEAGDGDRGDTGGVHRVRPG
jgi:hypothetical protein